MSVHEFLTIEVLIMVAALAASGLVRGFTGGAGANFLSAPVLAALIGPREAVPIVLLLNGVTIIQILPGALRHIQWREAAPIGIAGAAMIPLGVWALFAIDEDIMRRVIAAVAVVFSLLLLTGWRYHGRRSIAVSATAGGAGGVLAGAVSMGGPPVFLYLMAGSGNATANRAHFIAFATFVQVTALSLLFGVGAYSDRMLVLSAILLVPFVAAIWVGTRLFHVASEEVFRRVSLWGMAAVSLAIVLL